MIVVLIVILCALPILMNFGLITRWSFGFKHYPKAVGDLPPVSVLIAARDEADNIERCLQSVVALDYPHDSIEILVGDDDSSDATYQLAKSFENERPHIVVKQITASPTLRGKANVLAQLAQQATGEYLLFVDADIAVPPNWARQMVGAMDDNIGLAIGVTGIRNNAFQHIDWLYALGMVKVVTDMGLPVTGLGNNMIVSRKAYDAVGGYEQIPFSITEDYELFKQVSIARFGCRQVYQEDSLAVSEPKVGFVALMQQRKRWMQGAVQLPWYMVLLLATQALYYMAIIPLLILNLHWGLGMLVIKMVLQIVFMQRIATRINTKISVLNGCLFEGYNFVVSVASMFYYLIPVKVKWKGRAY